MSNEWNYQIEEMPKDRWLLGLIRTRQRISPVYKTYYPPGEPKELEVIFNEKTMFRKPGIYKRRAGKVEWPLAIEDFEELLAWREPYLC